MANGDRAAWLPVTTRSEVVRERFERGRAAAHHDQFVQAREHLDAALVEDPTFVLASLHRGGSADDAVDVRAFVDLEEANRERASDGEGLMIDAFHAFLVDGEYERAITIFAELASTYTADPYLPSYLVDVVTVGERACCRWAIRWMEAVENDAALHRVDVVTRPALHHATMSCDGRSHLEAFRGRSRAARLS